MKAAAAQRNVEEVFMTAIFPSDIEGQQANQYYDSEEAYLYAIADAMRHEYKAIVDSGLVLQIDDPRLLTYYISRPNLTVDDCRKWAELRVEVLNHALKGLPENRIRFHTCYGINIGPRVHEMNLVDIVDIMLKVNAGAYLFEFPSATWQSQRSSLPSDPKLFHRLQGNYDSRFVENYVTLREAVLAANFNIANDLGEFGSGVRIRSEAVPARALWEMSANSIFSPETRT